MKDFLGVLLVVTIVLLVFAIPVLFVIGLFPNYSDGERTGDIYKFSEKGIIWKSWEGVMYLGGLTSNANGGFQIEKFYFSIPASQSEDKKDLIETLRECASNRDITCTIHYKQWFLNPITISSRYVVEDVTVRN